MPAVYINRSADTFLLDAYTGKGGFLSGDYLIPHAREDADAFKERQAFASYPNYVADIVNTYSGYIWKCPPNREGGDAYTRFAANANGNGKSLDQFLSDAELLSQLLGTVWVIVDRVVGLPMTRAQQADPYVAMRLPGQLVDIKFDAMGGLDKIVFREEDLQQEVTNPNLLGMVGNFLNSVSALMGMGMGLGRQVYRHFDKLGWKITQDQGGKMIVAQGQHGLGIVPVVPMHSSRILLPGQFRADPWAFGTVQLNWALFNQTSEKRTLFRKQAFSILTIPVVDDNEAERLQDLTIGTDNALTYNPAGGGQPAYISPQDGPVQNYMKDNADLVVQIYEQANLQFIAGVHASGVSMAFQFQKANATLGTLAGLGEDSDRGIMRIVSRWNGEQEGRVTWNRNFELVDLKTDIETALSATSLQISPTFEKELKKGAARKYLGHAVSPETLAEIDAEIEANADPYGDRLASAANAGGMQ